MSRQGLWAFNFLMHPNIFFLDSTELPFDLEGTEVRCIQPPPPPSSKKEGKIGGKPIKLCGGVCSIV